MLRPWLSSDASRPAVAPLEQGLGEPRVKAPIVEARRLTVVTMPPSPERQSVEPGLILRWDTMTAQPASIDVVVQLPGCATEREQLDLTSLCPAGRGTPTLTVLPRSARYGGSQGQGADALPLTAPGGLMAVVDLALERFACVIGAERVALRRLIVAAHGGGGGTLLQLLAHSAPDEIYLFGGLSGGALPLIRWAVARIGRDRALSAAALAEQAGAMGLFYLPGARAERQSQIVGRVLATALAGAPDALRSRYRVEAAGSFAGSP